MDLIWWVFKSCVIAGSKLSDSIFFIFHDNNYIQKSAIGKMDFIFEVVDKTGRKIHLSKERWNHISSPNSLHPYMTNYLEEIKQALVKPDAIVQQNFNYKKYNYYKYLKERKEYLLVGVKYLNGDGYVTTAFITTHIRKR